MCNQQDLILNMGQTARTDLCSRLLDVMEGDILPKTRLGVNDGNKIFGAAILCKSDLSLIVADTNREIDNPLLHGEISALMTFYKLPAAERPSTSRCIFLATHEPCSLCLSAITWAGFDNFYYFFDYKDSQDTFHIGHDLKILDEVFQVRDGKYAHQNAFWHSQNILTLAAQTAGATRRKNDEQITRIKATYSKLSNIYQAAKNENKIPLK